MRHTWIRVLFGLSAAYDAVLGMTFLTAGPAVFDAGGVPHPNHWAYIQFAAALLIVFGAMFAAVAANPVAHRNLIPFGVLLKVSYVGVCGYYWATSGLPGMFQPFVAIDVVMLALFAVAYLQLRPQPATGGAGATASP